MTTVGNGSTFDAPTELGTTGSSMTSSPSRGASFYFQCVAVVVGVVGTAANGLVLYALVASKQHRKHALIFNQNLLDFASCLFLFVSNAAKIGDVHLEGTRGYWLCLMLVSEGPSWGPFVGSMINLAAVTVERYLKVCLLYTSPSPRDRQKSRMPSSA